MDKDQWDEQTERLLPCNCADRKPWDVPLGKHLGSCAIFSIPAVAATLREQGQEIARLREKCNQKDDEYARQVKFAESVIAELRAERAQLKAQLASAEKRGMEKAMEIAVAWVGAEKWSAQSTYAKKIEEAIRAEMEGKP